jgi:hypothetical protein
MPRLSSLRIYQSKRGADQLGAQLVKQFTEAAAGFYLQTQRYWRAREADDLASGKSYSKIGIRTSASKAYSARGIDPQSAANQETARNWEETASHASVRGWIAAFRTSGLNRLKTLCRRTKKRLQLLVFLV